MTQTVATTVVANSQVTGVRRELLTRSAKRGLVLATLLIGAALLVLRFRNTAFIDEALYINAGYAYLDHWLHNVPLGDAGAYFSGAPTLYPVLAALLDSLGGLWAVRAFSLLCMLGAALMLHETMDARYGPRAGLMTMGIFLLSGPVLYVGGLGTFDALVLFLLTVSICLAITFDGYGSAVVVGLVLPLMASVKYTSAIFIPVVLVAMLVFAPRLWRRVLVAVLTVAAVMGTAWVLWSDAIARDLAFTTTARQALSPATTPFLLGLGWQYAGLLLCVAIIGAVVLVRRYQPRWQSVLVAVGLLGAGLMLPAAQLRLGEAVSFEKHLAYSAVFLSMLAGIGLAHLSRRPLMHAPTILLLIIVALTGWARSDTLYEWVNVSPVVAAIDQNPRPGLYISSASDPLKYHTRNHPDIHWETTFTLYAEGEDAIRDAIAAERYQTIIVRDSSTGSGQQDDGQKILLDAVNNSLSYALAYKPIPVSRYTDDHWLIYTLRPEANRFGTTTTAPTTQEAPR